MTKILAGTIIIIMCLAVPASADWQGTVYYNGQPYKYATVKAYGPGNPTTGCGTRYYVLNEQDGMEEGGYYDALKAWAIIDDVYHSGILYVYDYYYDSQPKYGLDIILTPGDKEPR